MENSATDHSASSWVKSSADTVEMSAIRRVGKVTLNKNIYHFYQIRWSWSKYAFFGGFLLFGESLEISEDEDGVGFIPPRTGFPEAEVFVDEFFFFGELAGEGVEPLGGGVGVIEVALELVVRTDVVVFLRAVEEEDAVLFIGEIEAAGVRAGVGFAVFETDGIDKLSHVGEVVEAGFDEVFGLLEGVVDDDIP